jgi:prevent-host-death family protein
MGIVTVGVRDLKAHLSEYLRQVRSGQTIVITDHGKAVGRIMPVEQTLDERLRSMQEAGLIAWNGQTLPLLESPVINRSGKLVSDLVVEMRERDL